MDKVHCCYRYFDEGILENEEADAGLDGRTRLARPNSQARTGTQGNIVFPVQLTTRRVGNLTRLIHTLLYVMTIQAIDVKDLKIITGPY